LPGALTRVFHRDRIADGDGNRRWCPVGGRLADIGVRETVVLRILELPETEQGRCDKQ
jgi:hypothetical protein